MELKKFDTLLTTNDLDKFKEEHIKGSELEEQFVSNYIKAHTQDNVTSEDGFYNMLLTNAILLENIDLIKHILSLFHESNILVNVNRENFSPISAALLKKNEQILDLVEQYIQSMPETNEKVNLVGDSY
ncbi:hypothetical protein [Rickettsia helvetica]|uniref:Uncharacterized protein n=1 Tax=Rickettsia helvetica TaxID=35789 RepID=A0ABP0T2R0_RICHE|nr:hypothetical protein [Rickettsia helvetica]MCZ6884255.1 hypothetical protein [Rickettsia endosymbiont of Ixodes ricinus]MCZ6897005.1 hypothetical protein [Rickettsia endosymbiont of Ixodes ricinus]